MPEPFLPKPFRCEMGPHNGAVHIRLQGELDMSTVPVVEECLRSGLKGGSRRMVVDLRGLTFMDSTGLSLVTRWNNESRRDGFEFALIQGDARIQRLFDLTGLSGYFTFVSG